MSPQKMTMWEKYDSPYERTLLWGFVLFGYLLWGLAAYALHTGYATSSVWSILAMFIAVSIGCGLSVTPTLEHVGLLNGTEVIVDD